MPGVTSLSSLSPVFEHFYHGPVLATTNSTAVLQQINEILEKAKNQTHQNETEGHMSVFLPESLVICTRERPILCLLLMLGTLWLGYALYLIKRRYVHLLHLTGTVCHFWEYAYSIYCQKLMRILMTLISVVREVAALWMRRLSVTLS